MASMTAMKTPKPTHSHTDVIRLHVSEPRVVDSAVAKKARARPSPRRGARNEGLALTWRTPCGVLRSRPDRAGRRTNREPTVLTIRSPTVWVGRLLPFLVSKYRRLI